MSIIKLIIVGFLAILGAASIFSLGGKPQTGPGKVTPKGTACGVFIIISVMVYLVVLA